MNKKMIVAATVCSMALAACNAPKKSSFAGMDGEWNITAVEGRGLTTASSQIPYIGFDLKQGRVYGYSGCNRIMASIDLKTGKPAFSKMGSTMMACPDMDTERQVLAALSKVEKARKTDDGSVALLDADGKEVARLERRSEPMDYAALDGEWQVAKVYGQAPKESEGGSRPVLTFDTKAGRLGGNAGCNRVMGALEHGKDGAQSLTIQNPATTRMACPDMETERQVLAALGEVRTFGLLKGGRVGLFSADGMIVMELVKATAGQAE